MLAVFCAVFFVWLLVSNERKEKKMNEVIEEVEVLPSFSEEFFIDVAKEAKAVFIFDVTNDETVYEKGADDILPLASLAKLATTLTALKRYPEDTVVMISPRALAQAGNNFLISEETWRMDELLKFMLVTSSNDGAYALAESLSNKTGSSIDDFVRGMNEDVKELGLSSFSFLNESGLDLEKGAPSAMGSAREVAVLMQYLHEQYGEIVSASAFDGVVFRSLEGTQYKSINTNIVVEKVPSILVSKTGYTNMTGGNLAFMFEVGPGRPFLVVILGSTFTGRFSDAEELIDAVIQALQEKK